MTDESLTIDKINEALALIKAIAPPEAPDGLMLINGISGLKIMKNEMLTADTIIVSKRLFDMIYDSSDKKQSSS